ncbi:hypothetical protein V8B97DRAFT_1874690 [Scleroderma yunnanense]
MDSTPFLTPTSFIASAGSSALESSVIRPSLNSIMIGHTFTTLLLPLFIALFYFSNDYSRRTPIFVLNVVVIVLAFISGVLIDALAIHSILSPQQSWPLSINISIGLLGIFQSILVDLILLVRLVSIHPLIHLGLPRFALLTALPVLLKIGRITNVIIFTKLLADAAQGPQAAMKMASVWATTPCLKIEWTAQVADNSYASVAFLWSIRNKFSDREGVTSGIRATRVTFANRMRMISRIAVSNFVIPTLFSIAQLVVIYRGVSTPTVNDIVLVNTMVTVFGVVFATVWVGKERRRDVEAQNQRQPMKIDSQQLKQRSPGGLTQLETWKIATSMSSLTNPEVNRGGHQDMDGRVSVR